MKTGESDAYWQGYNDHRGGVDLDDGIYEGDYILGYDDSEYDKQNGHDAR